MNTFLDLLIVAVMALTAVSLVAAVLMFLVKNRRVRRVCLYITAALSVYVGYVGVRILWPGFPGQVVLAVLAALCGVGAVVLERVSGAEGKKFLIARILAAAALFVGMLNAFA